jgi:hypothetical protein
LKTDDAKTQKAGNVPREQMFNLNIDSPWTYCDAIVAAKLYQAFVVWKMVASDEKDQMLHVRWLCRKEEIYFLATQCAWQPLSNQRLSTSRQHAQSSLSIFAERRAVVGPYRECRRRHSKHTSARAKSAVDPCSFSLKPGDLPF